ncbi:MAG: hypothetical protein DHS20C02_11550 [Micavibrio sp.]|nr:MAG: hypothetical protein DHS20C02_11550 [Micavibrio sp.]
MNKDSSIILERRFVPEGTMIMKQGDSGNCAYLIQSGSVLVYTEHKGKHVELATLELGEIFGEMALIFDEPRTASVKALEDTNLIILTRETMKQKMARTDPTIKAIITMLTNRIVSANNTLMNKGSDMQDMTETARIIFQNVLNSLPKGEQRTFENAVLPKLDEFLDSVRAFKDRFNK